MIVFRKPLPGVERPAMEADVVIVGGGPAGMACALRLSQLIDEHNSKHPESPAHKGKHLRPGEGPGSGRALPLGRIARSTLDARVAARVREGSSARCRRHQGSCLLPDAQWQVQASHHAATHARSRQLRHLHQPLCKMAGGQGGRSWHHVVHRLRRFRVAI